MLSDLVPKIGFLRAAIILHKFLLVNVMRLPVAFFDVNPTGRLLSRFSKDIDDIDGRLPRCLDSLIFFSIEVICITINNIFMFIITHAVTNLQMYVSSPKNLTSTKKHIHTWKIRITQTQLFTAY